MKLTNVKGVDDKKAERLDKNGIYCAEDLASANVAFVDAIDGCGPDIVVNAIRLLEHDRTKMNHNEIKYTCSFCGQGQLANHATLRVHEDRCEGNEERDDEETGLFLTS